MRILCNLLINGKKYNFRTKNNEIQKLKAKYINK